MGWGGLWRARALPPFFSLPLFCAAHKHKHTLTRLYKFSYFLPPSPCFSPLAFRYQDASFFSPSRRVGSSIRGTNSISSSASGEQHAVEFKDVWAAADANVEASIFSSQIDSQIHL